MMRLAMLAQQYCDHHCLLFALIEPGDWPRLVWDMTLVVIYVVLGLVLFALAYLAIDKLTPFSLHKEILDEHNTAMAIVLGAVFIGIALILAAAIRGA